MHSPLNILAGPCGKQTGRLAVSVYKENEQKLPENNVPFLLQMRVHLHGNTTRNLPMPNSPEIESSSTAKRAGSEPQLMSFTTVLKEMWILLATLQTSRLGIVI